MDSYFSFGCNIELPSINHLYPTNFQGRKFLSKKGKEAKKVIELEYLRCKPNIPKWIYDKERRLNVEIEISLNWKNKDGTIKKRDLFNYEKFLTDTIFNLIGIDDCRIFSGSMEKADRTNTSKCWKENNGFNYIITEYT